MAKEIPTGSTRALIKFYSRQLHTPVLEVSLKFPRDDAEINAILNAWHSRTMNKEDMRFTLNEVVQEKSEDLGVVTPQITRQFCIDLHSILFIETLYYDDEPVKKG